MAEWRASEWPWTVRAYYGPHAKPPKREGQLAIEVRHKTAVGKDIEVSAAQSREDIGVVEVIDRG